MKLRNKKTGEIAEIPDGSSALWDIVQKSLPNSSVWEDVPEGPKEYWFVDSGGEVEEATYLTDNDKSSLRNFGNCFETREEAEKAVEKLKAWKRLKDKGFKFADYHIPAGEIYFDMEIPKDSLDEIAKDFTFLFGGEE